MIYGGRTKEGLRRLVPPEANPMMIDEGKTGSLVGWQNTGQEDEKPKGGEEEPKSGGSSRAINNTSLPRHKTSTPQVSMS